MWHGRPRSTLGERSKRRAFYSSSPGITIQATGGGRGLRDRRARERRSQFALVQGGDASDWLRGTGTILGRTHLCADREQVAMGAVVHVNAVVRRRYRDLARRWRVCRRRLLNHSGRVTVVYVRQRQLNGHGKQTGGGQNSRRSSEPGESCAAW